MPFHGEKGIVLGSNIFGGGIKVDNGKIDLIVNLPLPTCVAEVQSFLGHVDGDPSMPFDLKNQIKLGNFILVIKG